MTRSGKPIPKEWASWVCDGAFVWYYPVIGSSARRRGIVRGEPWQLGHGQWVVRLDGKAGGVAVEALSPRTWGDDVLDED